MNQFSRTTKSGLLALTLTLMATADATQQKSSVLIMDEGRPNQQSVETRSLGKRDVSNAKVRAAYVSLPLHFEANQGQADEQVKFVSRGSGYVLFLTSDEAVLVLNEPDEQSAVTHHRFAKTEDANSRIKTPRSPVQNVLRMKLVGGNLASQVRGVDSFHGKTNYLIGKDAKQWHTNVPTYAKVQYHDVYPGIDLIYHGNQRQLEYDFIVAPGNDPNTITLSFDGAKRLSLNESGELIIDMEKGMVQQKRPFIYQEIAGVKTEISGGYVLKENNQVGFQVASYDVTKALIIDPVLVNSTYLGGSGGEQGNAIAVDSQGNTYITGSTFSPNFPTTLNAYNPSRNGLHDVFVTKLNPNGSALVYSTYLGGSGVGVEAGLSIAVDSQGNAYVTGFTGASDFPTTAGAFDISHNGNNDAFVTKLNPNGSALLYSTFLGGTGFEQGNGITVDAQGNAYVIGDTGSSDFPTTPGAFDTSFDFADIFVTKLNPGGTALVYSTALGGGNVDHGSGIAVDSQGNAYVTGWTLTFNFPTTPGAFDVVLNGADAFVTKLNPNGSALLYSTFLGGSDNDQGNAIAVDSQGNAYVTGLTNSSDFPTTAGAFDTSHNGGFNDVFVTKLNPNGSALLYSTYLGGNGSDQGNGIAVDSSGNAYVTGDTSSTNFPTTPGAVDFSLGGAQDAFVVKLNSNASAVVYSTYLGGSDTDHGSGIAVDFAGNAYSTGQTNSLDFPTTDGAFQRNLGGFFLDAFVTKFSDTVVTSLAVYQTSTGNWFFNQLTLGFGQHLNFGGPNFLPVPGDYDGDGETDTAVYDTTNGNWFIAQSTAGFRIHPSFGGSGFIPVPGDYDGDEKTDVAVYQTSTGHWFIVGSTSGFMNHLAFGGSGFVPVPADYDGDGQTDTAVYETSIGHWFIAQSTAGFRVHPSFGGAGFIPVPGDYDGDGKTDVAVYQTSSGHWFFVGSTSGFNFHLAFGGAGFMPVPRDYDGDGQTDTAVYDTTTGNWFIARSTAGFVAHPSFGGLGFVPVLPQVTILRAMGLL